MDYYLLTAKGAQWLRFETDYPEEADMQHFISFFKNEADPDEIWSRGLVRPNLPCSLESLLKAALENDFLERVLGDDEPTKTH